MKPVLRLTLLLLLLLPFRSRAILGVGDVVYDPANVAETINVLHQAQQVFDRLGSILGVSTRQFDQLVQLAVAFGNANEAAPFLQSPSPQQIQSLVRSNPGMENVNLEALFNGNNQLDAFMGVPLDKWTQAVGNPVAFYRSILVQPAIARIGGSAGLAPSTVSYLQWYATRSPEDQYNLGPQASNDVSNLLNGAWLEGSEKRRLNLQGLSAANRDAQSKAAQAKTLTDQQHVQAQLHADTNAILIESASQATAAQEALLRTVGSQNQILQDRDEVLRNADEIRLDLPP